MFLSSRVTTCLKTTILDRVKWNSKPPSPLNQGWSRTKAKTYHFLILEITWRKRLAISELPLASISKRGLVRNYWYGNNLFYSQANKTHFHKKVLHSLALKLKWEYLDLQRIEKILLFETLTEKTMLTKFHFVFSVLCQDGGLALLHEWSWS